jgi:hypothetical protein
MGEPLSVKRITSKPVQTFVALQPSHPARHTTGLDLKVNAPITARQIADHPGFSVVTASVEFAALDAETFFERRESVRTSAALSPNIPLMDLLVLNPGN